MAIAIFSQPVPNSLVAAYRPIHFLLNASQQPASADPCPIIVADVYFNNVYYRSISVTDYEKAASWLFTWYLYEFDIQDLAQEYLRSFFPRIYEATSADMEDSEQFENFSCKCVVHFREGYYDSDGFVQYYGNAPVQGTKYTPPLDGDGTAISETFYILNGSLRHEDNQVLSIHLQSLQDPFQQTYGLSRRPNTIPYLPKVIGGGKYYVCKEDHDWIFCFCNQYKPTGGAPWYVGVFAKYRNGSTITITSTSIVYPATSTTEEDYKVYAFNAGIPNLRKMFATVQWDNVIEYEVFVYRPFLQIMRQYYYVEQGGCCGEHIRVFFLNNLGTYDAINFNHASEMTKTESLSWQSSLPGFFNPLPGSKSFSGMNRMQPKQSEVFEAYNSDYDERDMPWIKELLGSPRAYIHWPGGQEQPMGLIPVKIEDSEVLTRKREGRFEYLIAIKFSMSNERINIR